MCVQITAVLTSITEMLDGQGLQTSPVALYAALVATLQQTTNQPEVRPRCHTMPSGHSMPVCSSARPADILPLTLYVRRRCKWR